MATKNNKARVITIRGNKANLYNAVSDRDQNILGKKIAEARNGLGLSLAAFKTLLADYGVDVSIAAINKWENGGSSPNAYQLLALGDVFGLRSTADGRRAEICDRVALCVLRLATANPTPCAKTNKDCYGCAAVKMKNKKYKASSTSLHFTYYIRHSRPHDFTDAEQQPATINDFTPTKNPGAALRAVIRE